ncbi:urease accessory protein UreF [Halomonas marinisediminis]|uniref:Urease accessory protein UreF n=1 Tax=Halomonas marinisediminis TaxID=2546095 RepID=A0ABY2D486_9GAMM|nr:urease accessory UreF family protein [Halomonas marinisediminis]TDA95814.1 urease accessory protein UreF [Halomonas marinisediminis]
MAQGQAALLLLADGRLPAGGYAHSGGLEPTVQAGRVSDAAGLERFLVGRAETTGFVAAAFAAAACERAARDDTAALPALESELDARTPSPELRSVSRTLGRQLLRVMSTIHPHPHFALLGTAPHQPVVMGVAAAALGLGPRDAALAILHESVAGPAAAAAKLMRIDPFDVHAALARATERLDRLADAAADHADVPASELPSRGAPLSDIAAEHHRSWNVRLFAS